MTTDELIERLNENDQIHAEKGSGSICVYDNTGRIMLTFSDRATTIFDFAYNYQIAVESLNQESRKYANDLIDEYLHTPIDERKPEKKYAIAWAADDDGTANYLCKRYGDWCICKRRYGGFPNGALFTQKELDDLKKCNFALIDVLDKLKVRV